MAAKDFYWAGSMGATDGHCDFCSDEFSLKGVMYDAQHKGLWGCFCQDCFNVWDMELGLGKGQKYERRDDGKYWYVEGNS